MTAAGALTVHGVTDTAPLPDLAGLPGSPVLVETPGHTEGHVVFHLPDRDVLFTSDALVTLDPYTGHTGPQIVAGTATADSHRLTALRSRGLTGADTALPRHGGPWRTGIDEAVTRAIRRGAH
jgi:glyoxylase-like metal-dependent hydrolase (beta-lactamase superfamily II)